MPVDAAELTDLAVAALGEVTDPDTVGPLVDASEREPGVVDLGFECLLPGYPGWRWTVSTAHLEDAEPTVLEVELLPGDGSLLAPPWVPWAERLAEYRRTHADAAADETGVAAISSDELDEGADDEDDMDEDELTDDDDLDDDLDDDDELEGSGDGSDGELDEDENGDLDDDDALLDDDDDPLDDEDDDADR